MIISISGRKGSGKTVLSQELIARGFQKVSFADSLKEYCSKLYGFPYEWTQSQTHKEKILDIPYLWNSDSNNKLSELTNEKLIFDGNIVEFKTIRHMLQYIGTEVLRHHDSNFHVKKTLEKLDPDKNYCMDDTRFLNEKQFLESRGAICLFMIRPNNFEYSNHESEVQLNWTMFDYVIINDGTEKKLKKRFNRFVDTFLKKHRTRGLRIERKELISILEQNEYDIESVAKKINCKRDKLIWWCEKLLININLRNEYKINHKLFLEKNELTSYFAGLLAADGCLKGSGRSKRRYILDLTSIDKVLIEGFRNFSGCDKPIYHKLHKLNGNSIYYFVLNSPFIVENLKLWNIKPRKSTMEQIPDCIKENDDLLRYWLVGLIDGDGSIVLIKKPYKNKIHQTLSIKFLSSKQVIEFIQNHFKNIPSYIHQEKKIDNLYNLTFHGKNAIKLYREIYKGVGLPRKWDKMKEFIEYVERNE